MKQAIWHLLNDLLLAILFLIVYAVFNSIRLAAAAALAAGMAQFAWFKLASRRIAPLQRAGLGSLVILGGATLVTQDPRFQMAKLSLVYFGVAAAMLRRGWMISYIPGCSAECVRGDDGRGGLRLGGADGRTRIYQSDYRGAVRLRDL